MNPNVISDNARVFRDVVWPRVCDILGGGELIPVEGEATSKMCTLLDVFAGIDYWRIESDIAVQGIGSRISSVSPEGRLYNTFTLRYSLPSGRPTEFQKRVKALADDQFVVAKWTIHAYVLRDELVSVGIIDTRDLVRVAQVQELLLRESPDVPDCFISEGRNGADDSTFLVLPWEHLLQQPAVQMTVLKFETRQGAFRPILLPRRPATDPRPRT
jgi:hypothetical protein